LDGGIPKVISGGAHKAMEEALLKGFAPAIRQRVGKANILSKEGYDDVVNSDGEAVYREAIGMYGNALTTAGTK
jgi:hypothetical protein